MALEKLSTLNQQKKEFMKIGKRKLFFRAGANASRKEAYSITIPPPNVTGVLHIGHAFNNTSKIYLFDGNGCKDITLYGSRGQIMRA